MLIVNSSEGSFRRVLRAKIIVKAVNRPRHTLQSKAFKIRRKQFAVVE
jgi:hypothetical protein